MKTCYINRSHKSGRFNRRYRKVREARVLVALVSPIRLSAVAADYRRVVRLRHGDCSLLITSVPRRPSARTGASRVHRCMSMRRRQTRGVLREEQQTAREVAADGARR